ncbi:IS3 family transposase [Naumannella halotolerans]
MSVMASKKRKSYTPAYRREAARLVIDTGRPVAHVAREIGVGEQLLGRWVGIERARDDGPPPALDADERAELERLRVENTELRMDREFLKKAALLRDGESEPVSCYRLMAAEKATYEIARMARLLGVSRSGFYDWQARDTAGPSLREQRREELLMKIRQFHADSDAVYGSPRILADLRADGQQVSRKTVAKLMRQHQIVGISPRGWRPSTTIPDPHAGRLPDLVERRFDQGQLNRVWTSDITYLATAQGWLYLCAVRDGCSRRVIGWAITDHLRADLVDQALSMAYVLRGQLPTQVIFHADRGCQYTSAQIADLCADLGLLQSVGRTGVCWDNAATEAFWSTLKTEFYQRRTWTTKAEAKIATARWIEERFNRRRRHSSIGMMTPVQYEHHLHQTATLAA